MSNIRPSVRSLVENFLETQDGYHSRVDVLRVIEEESMLLKESQYIKDVLDSDPMEQFEKVKPQIERLKRILRVQSCSRIRTGNDCCKIDAVVCFNRCDDLELSFRYERKRRQDEDGRPSKFGFHIRYSIEMSVNHQQRENLLVVEVWTENDWPSIEKAVCINGMMEAHNSEHADNGDDDAGWEDITDDDEGPEGSTTLMEVSPLKDGTDAKRQKLDDGSEKESTERKNNGNGEPDSYIAYLDPDVLHEFLGLARIQSDEMHEGTTFFLLMTFPFYEQEWDLVGYLLEEMFGGEDDDE